MVTRGPIEAHGSITASEINLVQDIEKVDNSNSGNSASSSGASYLKATATGLDGHFSLDNENINMISLSATGKSTVENNNGDNGALLDLSYSNTDSPTTVGTSSSLSSSSDSSGISEISLLRARVNGLVALDITSTGLMNIAGMKTHAGGVSVGAGGVDVEAGGVSVRGGRYRYRLSMCC